jgi:glutathione synthase/RimK-type ligase-like ATP-grasp enzyme
MTSDHFDLGVAWDWEHDSEFICILEAQTHNHHLRFFSISHHNVHESLKRLQKGTLSFGAFLDRASDADENFLPLARYLKKSSLLFLNHPDAVHHAIDKATMHLEFITKGIDVPFTIIISPFNKKTETELSIGDLAKLGRPFIIKPANTTGGGVGVILGAETLKDVIESRQHHKNDKYLLQERITPVRFHNRKAWFRVFYICGAVIPCWWDDDTHIYKTITRGEVSDAGLRPLIGITRKIWEVCKLEFFSTEIAMTSEKKFVVVDYVNDICDMRLQSKHVDGVPDVVVNEVCKRIARHIRTLQL